MKTDVEETRKGWSSVLFSIRSLIQCPSGENRIFFPLLFPIFLHDSLHHMKNPKGMMMTMSGKEEEEGGFCSFFLFRSTTKSTDSFNNRER